MKNIKSQVLMESLSLKDAALYYAHMGWKVFPLAPLSKKPAHPKAKQPDGSFLGGSKLATTCPKQIQNWWNENQNYNIGLISPEGIFAVDVDVRDGKQGMAQLAKLDLPNNTLTQRSASGGFHIFLRGETPRKANPDFKHIDIKSHTGYLVAAPSKLDDGGTYEWVMDFTPDTIKQAPAHLYDRLGHKTQSNSSSSGQQLTRSLEEIESYLNQLPKSATEEYADWIEVGAALHHQWKGDETGLDQWHKLSERNDSYDATQLDKKWQTFDSSKANAKTLKGVLNKYGIETPVDPEIAFAGMFEEEEPEDSNQAPKPTKKSTLKLWDAESLKARKRPVEFVEGLLAENKFSYIYGPSTAGKSTAALHLAYHVANGLNWLGKRVKQKPVLYIGLEGETGVFDRIRALEIEHNLPSQIHVMTGHWGMADDKETLRHVLETAREIKAGYIIIDTMARAMAGLDENSSQEMGRIINMAGQIQTCTKAHVQFIHHTGKDKSKGARGSSALKAAADLEIFVDRDGQSPNRTFEVQKNKDGREGEKFDFRIEGLEIDSINSWGNKVNAAIIRNSNPLAAFEEEPEAEPLSERDEKALKILRRKTIINAASRDDWADALKKAGWRSDLIKQPSWRSAFSRTIKSLEDCGKIKLEDRDKYVTI